MARWYIIHAYSGFENKVRNSIIAEAQRMGLSEAVEAVEVPTETVTEVKRGKKVQVERKFMPGYVLAKLRLTDDVYHLIKNTPKVTGFLGSAGKPQPISEREAARYFGAQEEAKAAPQARDPRRLRDRRPVKVLDGPFASFNGVVEELDFDKQPGQGLGLDLRPRDAGRTRLRSRSNWSSDGLRVEFRRPFAGAPLPDADSTGKPRGRLRFGKPFVPLTMRPRESRADSEKGGQPWPRRSRAISSSRCPRAPPIRHRRSAQRWVSAASTSWSSARRSTPRRRTSRRAMPIPTVITVYADRSFTFVTKTPPASYLIKKAANLKSGSKEPGKVSAGKIKR